MRSQKLKYLGAVVAVIGFIILAALGAVYAWDKARNWLEIDMGAAAPYAVLGATLLIGGLATYALVDE